MFFCKTGCAIGFPMDSTKTGPATHTFAERFKQLVERSGKPVQTIGEGRDRSYIYRLMKGEASPTLDTLEAVLRQFGSSIAEFFEDWPAAQGKERHSWLARAEEILSRNDSQSQDLKAYIEFLESRAPPAKTRSKRRRA